jgi:hypothetical protein
MRNGLHIDTIKVRCSVDSTCTGYSIPTPSPVDTDSAYFDAKKSSIEGNKLGILAIQSHPWFKTKM